MMRSCCSWISRGRGSAILIRGKEQTRRLGSKDSGCLWANVDVLSRRRDQRADENVRRALRTPLHIRNGAVLVSVSVPFPGIQFEFMVHTEISKYQLLNMLLTQNRGV